MNILVVGGAGYIGSHMVLKLSGMGFSVFSLDNLSTGYEDAVKGGVFIRGDLADRTHLEQVLRQRRIDVVMHFASSIQVEESVRDPAKYYRNNLVNTINLLDAMALTGVRYLIFSSSAAVYGEPERVPIDETQPLRPVNPYGRIKMMTELALGDYDRAYGIKSVSLRYFNAAGADPQGRLGERHEPETHLIPLVLQAAKGMCPALTVYGDDYETPDGTCVRDYVHVSDLCDAHLLAMNWLVNNNMSDVFNLGNGSGYSVKQVFDTAREVTGREIPVVVGRRRPGDQACLVADPAKAVSVLGWKPMYSMLDSIIGHAWEWERRRYGASS